MAALDDGRSPYRYAIVSLGTMAFGQIILIALYGLGMSAALANIISFVSASFPSYYYTRRWTFKVRGPTRWIGEVLPFWAFTLFHLLASTTAATVAAAAVDTLPGGRFAHGVLISGFVILMGVLLWILKYFALRATFLRPIRES